MKKIIVGFVLLFLVVISFNFYSLLFSNSTEKKEKSVQEVEIEKEQYDGQENNESEKNTTEILDESPKESSIENNSNNYSVSRNEQAQTSSSNNNNNSSNKESDIQVEPSKELTEWEKLGISEYDYYNSPAWSWQTVDFGINLADNKKCSNENECLLKCQNYGNEYLKSHSGGFKCNNVLSYSGQYIGEDFEFFELEP